MSLLETVGNSDLHETRKIVYYSKGNDESCPKNVIFIEIEWLNQ